jgi:hypothetical protein
MIEALACNTPVVSKSLENMPEDKRSKCGKTPRDESEMTENIIEVLNTLENYKNTREIVEALLTTVQFRKCHEFIMIN